MVLLSAPRHARRQRTARLLPALGVPLALLMVCSPAMALYKVVGADGKVTYTDRPPSDRASQALKTNGSVSDTGSLPFELRQVSTKFPVTLYGARDCSPCEQGRTLLKERGIPYTERSVQTAEDIQALKRQEGTDQLPVLRVGGQQLKGYASQSWQSYLDAAGYPKVSALPRGYQWPQPSPLVQQASAAAPAAVAPGTTAAGSTTTTPATTPTPSGIRF